MPRLRYFTTISILISFIGAASLYVISNTGLTHRASGRCQNERFIGRLSAMFL